MPLFSSGRDSPGNSEGAPSIHPLDRPRVGELSSRGNYPELNALYLRPILVAGLPAMPFVALDTRLGLNFANGTFVPPRKAGTCPLETRPVRMNHLRGAC